MLHCFVWLFPKIKSSLNGRRFQGTEDIKNWRRHWKLFPKLFPKVHSCSREILLTGMLETKSFRELHSRTSSVRPFCIVPQPFKFTIVQPIVRPCGGERAWPYEPTSDWHGALYKGPRNESWAEFLSSFVSCLVLDATRRQCTGGCKGRGRKAIVSSLNELAWRAW
jgi:hypothetical protein